MTVEPAAPEPPRNQTGPDPSPPQPQGGTDTTHAPGSDGATDTGATQNVLGYDPDSGDFLARFAGREFRVSAADLAAPDAALDRLRLPVPGLRLTGLRYRRNARALRLTTALDIPSLAEGSITVNVNRRGVVSASGTLNRRFDAPGLHDARVRLAMSEDGQLSASGRIAANNLLPRALRRRISASGEVELSLTDGALAGSGTITMTYADLGSGTVTVSFSNEGVSATGQITVTPPFLNEVTADVSADDQGNIRASADIDVGQQSSPVPNLTLSAGTIHLGYDNGAIDLSIANFSAGYAGLGNITIASLSLGRDGKPAGSGSFAGDVPFLSELSGDVSVRAGKVSGSMTIAADEMPEAMPITSGAITARLGEDGAVSLSGEMQASFGPAGTAAISGTYDANGFDISGEASLTIPGLNQVTLRAHVTNDDLSGSVNVPVDSAFLPGLTGDVTVTYAQGRWGGETTLNYSADDGKLSGTITITVTQTDEGAIEVGGTGSVTAQLMPGLQGTLTATILPEGGVDVSGEIVVTEPYELFPEWRDDKELFRHSQNIPLWAILVAVIRVRAGVRAGVGPGVFRDIRVTGSYTIGADQSDPSFDISGELYIPAFVEGYVAFGAGLGLDVVLGSLTGGIEGVATAGLYGAISVVPTLSYADGDWSIEGVATLAAGARLKMGLNAWAEVEAAWVTVWENTWALAEHTMPIGPDLGLQATMNYTFGQPQPPTIEFNSSEVDTERLIQDAMPEDGPAPSGAREALQNRAEWRGQLREQREAPVPADQQAQATQGQTPPAAPARPSGGASGGPPATEPGAGDAAAGGGTTSPSGTPAAQSQAVDQAATPDPTAAGTVPADQAPPADQPRYPNGITLGMLDEDPVPANRTPAQQQQDLAAARRVLEMASAQASNSDTLDDYFPRVKKRFRLTSLGYEGDFQSGFKIKGKINPEFELTVHEPLSGRGIPGGDERMTSVVHTSSSLGGDRVGVEMMAMPLGPDHAEGSGPSGQRALFSKLPTGFEFSRRAHSNFIKGHLLNDNVGGLGVGQNLFPITAHANSQHSRSIEEAVKDWVNTRRLWVRYHVKITDVTHDLGPGIADNYVNATMTAKAEVLDTTLKPVSGLVRQVTIQSVFEQPAEAATQATEDAAGLEAHTQQAATERPQDQDIEILTTSRAGGSAPPQMPQPMFQRLRSKINDVGYPAVSAILQQYPGFGPSLSASLLAGYQLAVQNGNAALDGLGARDKSNVRRAITLWNAGMGALL